MWNRQVGTWVLRTRAFHFFLSPANASSWIPPSCVPGVCTYNMYVPDVLPRARYLPPPASAHPSGDARPGTCSNLTEPRWTA
ncbi:hypothetical protein GGS23DRAFT_138599 [Durotheca rogersii]|uniref:uncharacterized protein n=1 Tax=Durotheca rogersii TaxID=419775 RepID=UPI0022209716|nr:uncharacterized protein GGS23DRAFT_138599 [Durotheca rogersii]KAI5861550.1 hypothetical protein GGS23DRAFT_138599 [Durotheca rogersii]